MWAPSSTAPTAPPGGLLAGYAPPAGVHDELLTEAGEVRPHWRRFLERLSALGPAELERRWVKSRHLLHENGVSYNVYGDPRGMDRPWSLSPVPVLIGPEEWASLSEGVAQRARLLDLLLADLYGPQRALAEGWLPPELIFTHPYFLRPLHGLRLPRTSWLPLYGIDLVRAEDARWRALADRTQAPSGAGYALENRIIVSQVLPDLFRGCNVERLALYFRSLQETLAGLAPFNRDNPRVVLLTPGPHNATYFEQAYLAQYLGYTLASGGDLTVRDDRVYLKTLSGLQPVDVILRRVNDDYCDPLELRQESVLGVSALVQAIRQGNVALANPIGTGLVQSPAFLPYLPTLARHLLGEELKLGSAETFWCGDARALPAVLDRFDTLVLKPAFAEGFTHPIFVSTLAAEERAALRARVLASPREWVAQEHIPASTTPLLAGENLVPRALVLRGYAVASGGRYTVMPGGLARVARSADNPEVSMQVGAGSKDTWVLASGPASSFSLLPPASHAVELSRGGGDLPSRVADNLYWLGRYAERAEAIARLARVTMARLRDAPAEPGLWQSSGLQLLLGVLAAQADLEMNALGSPLPTAPASITEDQLLATLFDRHEGSLAAVIQKVLRVARTVRDRLSADTWRVLTALDDELDAPPTSLRPPEPRKDPSTDGAEVARLDRTVLALAAFAGLATESMTRGQAWRFLDMGRRMERASTLVLLLSRTLVDQSEGPLLEAILEVADSGMTYRRRYLANLQVAPVLDLLLTDETNPRSVFFQLRALVDHLAALPTQSAGGTRTPQQRIAIAAQAELQLADADALARTDAAGKRPALETLLTRLADQLPALSDSLSSSYLSHAAVSRNLGTQRGPVLDPDDDRGFGKGEP
jgi:uncharacterized circularly permuted ATP-grasp superfamily protein/uncharacterized alpha-E superfamily protein